MTLLSRCVVLSLLFSAGTTQGTEDRPRQISNLDKVEPSAVLAASCATFLSSVGVNTHVDQGYDPLSYVQPIRYLGVRNIRDGWSNVAGLTMLHAQTGILVDLLGSDVGQMVVAANTLSRTEALLAIEGPNEPNNFPIKYNGQEGGASQSWDAVAKLQAALYQKIKSNLDLKGYPVFHISEGGAETDNVGMQFLTIPVGADAAVADGTQFADYANVHNYVSGVRAGYVDNQAWQAADPTLNGRWDGLYGSYGKTWKRHFRGYSNAELEKLPRVTTETGWDAASSADERVQGIVLVNTYLAQFKRGWRYTFIYELGEGEGGGGHQGLFHQDWTPKLAATYIHNLTSILADNGIAPSLGKLNYSVTNAGGSVHDLLLQKNDGSFELVIWGEQVAGESNVVVNLDEDHATVKIFDVTLGDTPNKVLTGVSRIPLTIGDHALVVEIR